MTDEELIHSAVSMIGGWDGYHLAKLYWFKWVDADTPALAQQLHAEIFIMGIKQ